MQRLSAIAFLVMFAVSTPALGDLDKAQAAYERGDYPAALEEMRVLAEQGDALAQNNLGAFYGNGFGVPKDYVEANEWYRKAAEQSLAEAQTNLDLNYYRGLGTNPDPVAAYMWLTLAARQGDKDAILSIKILTDAMSAADVSEANRLPRQWLEEHEAR